MLGAGLEPAWLAAGEKLGPGCTVHTEQCEPGRESWGSWEGWTQHRFSVLAFAKDLGVRVGFWESPGPAPLWG